jgi:hypothetical protein
MQSQQTLPQAGDVLISKPTAVVEHDVSIVPTSTSVLRARYELAVTEAQKLAEQLRVDLWFTADHTHCSWLDTEGDKTTQGAMRPHLMAHWTSSALVFTPSPLIR